MNELSNNEINEVSGATSQDATSLAGGIFVGGCVGFLVGGPVGAVAGAASAGIHALLISHYVFG